MEPQLFIIIGINSGLTNKNYFLTPIIFQTKFATVDVN